MKKATNVKRGARVRSGVLLGGSPATIADKLETITKSVNKLQAVIGYGPDVSGVLLEVENDKPVIRVMGLNGEKVDEDFMEHVEWIGDHGGPDQRPEEVKIWRDAFLSAAKRCDEILST
jgi:hypothetical protein